MGFSAGIGVSAGAVFLQGLLSFFSPCVLPLLPLYMGYLAGGAGGQAEDARRVRVRTAVNTLFFVVGISFAFFVLGLGMTALGRFLGERQALLARVGGVIVILFGLYQLGVLGRWKTLERERRLPLRLEGFAMSPLTALVMGFVFSFAWTPCVGPALSGVLLMAASASERGMGLALIGVYTLGFVIPFLALGLFTTSLLALFRRHRGVVRYTARIGGALLVVMGMLMLTGTMNSVSGYLARVSQTETAQREPSPPAPTPDPEPPADAVTAGEDEGKDEAEGTEDAEGSEDAAVTLYPAYDFTLRDQYGQLHTLSDYRGQVVFLNFWATWCPPCRAEMPDIQALYEKYSAVPDSGVVVLGVAFPDYGSETDEQGIVDFLYENGYEYPVLMDTTQELLSEYFIMAWPTTFMIDADGDLYGYVAGALTLENMEEIIRQTVEGIR